MARRIDRFFRTVRIDLVSPVAWMVIGVPWRLRHPRRLTVLAIAMKAPNAVFYVLRGGPGRAAAQAEDGRRVSPGCSRCTVAAGTSNNQNENVVSKGPKPQPEILVWGYFYVYTLKISIVQVITVLKQYLNKFVYTRQF